MVHRAGVRHVLAVTLRGGSELIVERQGRESVLAAQRIDAAEQIEDGVGLG